MKVPTHQRHHGVFMLPVTTPLNVIVFGSGHVSMGRMVRARIILNFVGMLLITPLVYLVAKPMLDIGRRTPAGRAS